LVTHYIYDACYYIIHSLSHHNGIHSDYRFSTYNWFLSSLQSFQRMHESGIIHLLHMHIPLAVTPQLLLTWHPPVVTGIVHLGPRLSVNCSPLFPIVPLCPPLQTPNPFSDFPEPNVHLIKARLNPLPRIPNKMCLLPIFSRHVS
jgi:hypothetical protein